MCYYITIYYIIFLLYYLLPNRDLRPPPMTKHPYYYFLQANDNSSSDNSVSKPSFDYQSEIWTKPMTITKYPGKERQVSIEKGATIPLSESLRLVLYC